MTSDRRNKEEGDENEEEAVNPGFNFAQTRQSLVRAIQGHSGELSALELMHVAIPLGILVSCVKLLHLSHRTHRRWTLGEGQKVCFPQTLFGDTRRIRCIETKQSTQEQVVAQDAVYWVNLGTAQEKGLQFWQTRSHATILYDCQLIALKKW